MTWGMTVYKLIVSKKQFSNQYSTNTIMYMQPQCIAKITKIWSNEIKCWEMFQFKKAEKPMLRQVGFHRTEKCSVKISMHLHKKPSIHRYFKGVIKNCIKKRPSSTPWFAYNTDLLLVCLLFMIFISWNENKIENRLFYFYPC